MHLLKVFAKNGKLQELLDDAKKREANKPPTDDAKK